MSPPVLVLVLFLVGSGAGFGCADPIDPPDDAGDAGAADATAGRDTGLADLGAGDAAIDAGPEDAAAPDGGDPDAAIDAGQIDAGVDAGHLDSGEPDAGEPDAGERDAGTPDAGQPGRFALLPVNGANWNDYVDGPWSRVGDLSVADAPCATTPRGRDCVHAGELRRIDTGLTAACAGHSIRDQLGAFEWRCEDSTGTLHAISVGLDPSARLSDLIDFAGQSWRPNSVIVNDGSVDVFTSSPAAWWSNPIEVRNGGVESVQAPAGGIYLVTTSTAARYVIGEDRVGLVMAPSVTVRGPGTGPSVVSVLGARHAWVEGRVDAAGYTAGVTFGATDHSVIRGLHVENASGSSPSGGVVLDNAWNNRLSDLSLVRNSFGVLLENNPFRESHRNRVWSVRGARNTSRLVWAGTANLLWDLHASNHRFHAVGFVVASHLAMLTSGNDGGGVQAFSRGGGIYLNATITNAQEGGSTVAGNGVSVIGSDHNYFGGFAVVNSRQFGVRASSTNTGNVYADLYSGHNQNADVSILVADNTTFTGVLKVTGTCEATGAGPGLVHRTCTDTGQYGSSSYAGQLSDAVLSRPARVGASFVGLVTADDLANPHDNVTPGLAPHDLITDWFSFDTPHRAFGQSGTGTFPRSTHRSACEPGEICQIWDWSLALGDTGDYGPDGMPNTADDRPVLLDARPLPDGDDVWTHSYDLGASTAAQTICEAIIGATWTASTQACTSRFLRRAIERMGDRIGNDNLLCESGETCIYTPNIGAYQGHGALVSAGPFVDSTSGGMTGITLLRYANNGRP